MFAKKRERTPLITFDMADSGWITGEFNIGGIKHKFYISYLFGHINCLLERLHYMLYFEDALDPMYWYVQEDRYQEFYDSDGKLYGEYDFLLEDEGDNTRVRIENKGEQIRIKVFHDAENKVVIDALCSKRDFIQDVVSSCDNIYRKYGICGQRSRYFESPIIDIVMFLCLKAYVLGRPLRLRWNKKTERHTLRGEEREIVQAKLK